MSAKTKGALRLGYLIRGILKALLISTRSIFG